MMMKISVIVMMMVAVIFATLQSESHLLNLIREEAERLLSNTSEKELERRLAVASDTVSGNKKCWKGFFCRAEKSLKAANLLQLRKLERYIEQYNKNHSVTCDLKNHNDTLKTFLKEVEECTWFFNISKQRVHMKKH